MDVFDKILFVVLRLASICIFGLVAAVIWHLVTPIEWHFLPS